MIGYELDLKSLGKRSAFNAHAAFDEAGAGNTIGLIGAPVLDPTLGDKGGVTHLRYPIFETILDEYTQNERVIHL